MCRGRMTVSENATLLKSSKTENLNFLMSRNTRSNRLFGPI